MGKKKHRNPSMGFTTCSRPEQQCVSQVLFDANLAELPEKADAADATG